MATDTERLIFLLEANTKRFENALARADKNTERKFQNMEKRAQLMEQRLRQSMENAVRAPRGGFDPTDLTNLISAVAVGAVVNETKNLADAYTNLANQMKLYSSSASEANAATQFVIDTAAAARVPVEELARVYAAAARSAGDLGLDLEQTEAVVEATARASALASTSASGMAGALMQFSQALGSGMVQAEEFNSIMDGTPALAQALARGIEEAGGSVSKLRKMVLEGEVSSQMFARALLTQLPEIRKQFENLTPSIDQSFGVLRTRLIEFIGQADDAAQATENISKFIIKVADDLELFGSAAIVFVGSFVEAGVAIAKLAAPVAALAVAAVALRNAVIAAGFAIGGMSAATQVAVVAATGASVATAKFTAALVALRTASLKLMATPLGWAIAAVTIALGYATVKAMENAREQERLAEIERQRTVASQELEDAVMQVVAADEASRQAAMDNLRAMRDNRIEAERRAEAEYNLSIELFNRARAELAAARAASRAEAQRNRSVVAAKTGMFATPETRAAEAEAERRAAEAERKAEAAAIALENAQVAAEESRQAYQRRQNAPSAPARSAAGETSTSRDRRGPSAETLRNERIRRQREQQDAQDQELERLLDLARARGEDTRALEDQLAARRMAASLDRDGLITRNNMIKAEQHIAELRRLSNEQRERELAAMERETQIAEAMVRGDWETVRALERASEIQDRISQYQALGLSLAEATARATADVERLRAANVEQANREVQIEQDQLRLAQLRADGLHDQADELEAHLELLELIDRYERAGVENARQKAEETQRLLRLERQGARNRAEVDRLLDREIELLRLRGLDREAEAREREARIRDRSREIARNRNMDINEARDQARLEIDEEDQARMEGQIREIWREGVRAWWAQDGDALENYLSSLLDRVLANLADNFTDMIFNAFKEGSKGAEIPGTEGIGAGTGGSEGWGRFWSAVGGLFGISGRRAAGGTTQAGKNYLVGENGPEIWSSTSAGRVANASATQKMLGSGGTNVYVDVQAVGAVLADQIYRDMARAVQVAIAAAPGHVSKVDRTRRRYSKA